MILKNIFISFHCDKESIQYVLTLKLLIKEHSNENIRICSIGNSINSTNKSYIKNIIVNKINACDEFACLVDKNTHYSNWVNWEINTACNLKKKIFVIKIHNDYIMPKSLFGENFNIINPIKFFILLN